MTTAAFSVCGAEANARATARRQNIAENSLSRLCERLPFLTLFIAERCIVQRDGAICSSLIADLRTKHADLTLLAASSLETPIVEHINKLAFFEQFAPTDDAFCVISKTKKGSRTLQAIKKTLLCFTASSRNCKCDYRAYNGRCYRVHMESRTFEGAKRECAADGAHLILVHDDAINTFLTGLPPPLQRCERKTPRLQILLYAQ